MTSEKWEKWVKIAVIEGKAAKEIARWKELTGVLSWKKRKVKGKTILEIYTDTTQVQRPS